MKITFRLLLCLPLLGGCQSSSKVDDLLAGRKIDYQQDVGQQQRQLQYPPDLIAAGTDVEGTVSLSEYAIRSLPEINDEVAEEISPAAEVAYRRDGRLRWIAVKQPPAALWTRVVNFWKDELGFPVLKESEKIGVIETGWLDLRRGDIDAPGTLRYFDEVFNVLRDSGDRDKFITRLERNNSGGTDIYVSHRNVAGRYDADTGSFSGYEVAPNKVELEVEMMRRLMVYLSKHGGADDAAAEDDGAIAEQIAEQEIAGEGGDYEVSETELLIKRPFLDGWRLVQIALDRGGFDIEDRDYEGGVVYIRHSGGPESDQIFGGQSEGLFSNLFGGDTQTLRDIKLLLHDDGDITRVTAEAGKDGEALTGEQRAILLNLLYERLP